MRYLPSSPASDLPSTQESSHKIDWGHSTALEAGLRHVTVRQILRATHVSNKFEIEGRETGFVSLIANVYVVNYNGGILDYGLDDGTGRIKASMWDVEREYAKRQLAEYELQNFSYMRAIGRISEYHNIHSVKLVKIDFVEDPHEIYHHLLSVMVETIRFQRGPPSHEAMQVVSQKVSGARAPDFSMQSLRKHLPNSSRTQNSLQAPNIKPQPPSPGPYENGQQIPEYTFEAPPSYTPQMPDPVLQPSESRSAWGGELPRRRNFRIGGSFSTAGPARELPGSFRMRPSHSDSGSATAEGPPSACSGPSAAVIPSQTGHGLRSGDSSGDGGESSVEVEDIPMDPLPRPAAKFTTKLPQPATESKLPRRDPYSHLTSLQRDVILTIQNLLSNTGETSTGVPLTVLVQTIVGRRPQLSKREFEDAFNFLVDEGYIYDTIDDNHYACT